MRTETTPACHDPLNECLADDPNRLTCATCGTAVVALDPNPDVEVCGEHYDHDLRLIDERDGIRVEECRSCGAEVVSDDEDDDAPVSSAAGEVCP